MYIMVQSRFIIALPALSSTCSVQFLSVSFCPSKKKESLTRIRLPLYYMALKKIFLKLFFCELQLNISFLTRLISVDEIAWFFFFLNRVQSVAFAFSLWAPFIKLTSLSWMWSFLYYKTECVLQINTEIYFYLISYAISIGKFILETKKNSFSKLPYN